MSDAKPPLSLYAPDAPLRRRQSSYPEPLARRMAGREKQRLGDVFGLTSFGVNRTTLSPGAQSALLHRHTVSDELIYVLEGHPTLVTDEGEVRLRPGDCAGFAAGGRAHHLVNRSDAPAVVLEIGDRQPGDGATYPHDDLVAAQDDRGAWVFTHTDGTPYPPRDGG